jgi:hypothetical protein
MTTAPASSPVAEAPKNVAAFIEASNANDLEALIATLAPDVSVTDEGTTHVGPAAVRAWRQNIPGLTSIRRDITDVHDQDSYGTVTVDVTGDFAGSPVTLHYDYALAPSGLIALLVIHA